jgi:RNA polymerase sigma factor (sigma-70 family)
MEKNAKVLPSILRSRLEVVAREYYNPLRAFFRKRTRNAPEVEDLVQQVFVSLSQHLEGGAIKNPDAYIFKTASNALRDYRRREMVRGKVIDRHLGQVSESDETVSDFPPERVLISEEAMEIVADTLGRLPERTSDVFMLRYFEGLKYMEIARLQDMTVRTVENHLVNEALEQRHECL